MNHKIFYIRKSYAKKIIHTLKPLDIDIEVLGEREIKHLGILEVGQGSQNESKCLARTIITKKRELFLPILWHKKYSFILHFHPPFLRQPEHRL